ncbi:SagB/ThcOx family dehydrogenase [Candidatus Woesearchaeota archaeon]|nr:SagB/ThcOx family dehydrogenase [Candidatus Woesearchaeota archaeon]
MNDKIKKFYEEVTSSSNQLPLSPDTWPEEWIKVFWKTYPRLPQVPLINTELNLQKKLQSVLLGRESSRDYNTPINFLELSALLNFSAGLNGKGSKEQPRRTYPSAGARYPIELYIFSAEIDGLDNGAYHYNVKQNTLELLISGAVDENINTILKTQHEDMFKKLSALVIFTTVISRTQIKYGSSAYPLSLIECGHIAQNIYLVSENLGLRCCAIGGFDTQHTSDILDLTEEELPLYGVVIGKFRLY